MRLRLAANIMLVILVAVILFHLLVITQFIPFKNVWGGRLKTVEEMYVFESVSLLINFFLIFITLQKANYIRPFLPGKVITFSFWLFVVIFGLNTIGNLFAEQLIEKILGTLFTLLSTYLCWTIAKKRPEVA